ncbi:MAG: helix-turn-helix domain-containing protein [Betaproteobacteria bacterium]
MGFATALREVREQLRLSQRQIGSMAYVSEKMVQAVEAGRRRFTPDVVGRIVDRLGAPRLFMEAAREVTGGPFSSPWLDGERVDLHRSSVATKLREELREAFAAVDTLDLVNKPRADKLIQDRVREVLLQVLDAHVAIDHFVAIVAPEFGISVRSLFADHELKLRERGLIRRETLTKGRTRAAC